MFGGEARETNCDKFWLLLAYVPRSPALLGDAARARCLSLTHVTNFLFSAPSSARVHGQATDPILINNTFAHTLRKRFLLSRRRSNFKIFSLIFCVPAAEATHRLSFFLSLTFISPTPLYTYACHRCLSFLLCIKMKVSQERLQIDLDVPLALSYASKAREEREKGGRKNKRKILQRRAGRRL